MAQQQNIETNTSNIQKKFATVESKILVLSPERAQRIIWSTRRKWQQKAKTPKHSGLTERILNRPLMASLRPLNIASTLTAQTCLPDQMVYFGIGRARAYNAGVTADLVPPRIWSPLAHIR